MNPTSPPSQAAAAAPEAATHTLIEKARDHLGSAVVSDVLDAAGFRRQCLGPASALWSETTSSWARPFPSRSSGSSTSRRTFAGLLAALDAIGPGDVFVTPTQRATDIAVWSELSTASGRRGAVGAITDGLIRDTRAVRGLDFPVISAWNDPLRQQGTPRGGEPRRPCEIDGVRICRGDLIVGDSDGVVVVPQRLVDEVLEAALVKRSSEDEFRAAVADGMLATEALPQVRRPITRSTARQRSDMTQPSDPDVRRVLVMFKTHLDVGFTDTETAVVDAYFTHHIPLGRTDGPRAEEPWRSRTFRLDGAGLAALHLPRAVAWLRPA